MKVDGKKSYMATSAELVSGRNMVSVGEVARALDVEVQWNNKFKPF